MPAPQALADVAKIVKDGGVRIESVRTLLSWFGAYRRSWRNVQRIRRAMDELGLATSPDFEAQYIDSDVVFRTKGPPQPRVAEVGEATGPSRDAASAAESAPTQSTVGAAALTAATPLAEVQRADPAHRISRLASANTAPLRVPPDATVEQAVTLMLQHDFSQLPVMTSDREVKGLFSWKSLGIRLSLGRPCTTVRECMDRHQEIASDGTIFDAVRIIAEHDCVLVRDPTRLLCGIVTASDISVQFQQLAEPFLILGDIENNIRYIIAAKFTVADLQAAKDANDQERKIEDVSDLTFGEYVRFLQKEENWKKLGTRIDRKAFTDELDKVREIRNDVMHFDPDPIDAADAGLLKRFANFLERRLPLVPFPVDQFRT